jgi:hypothetical protein
MTKEELRKLTRKLPKGSRERLRQQFGFKHRGTVNNILSGQRENELVILAAAAIVDEHLRNMEQATVLAQSL